MRPPTQHCIVRAADNGWEVDLVAITKVVYAKPAPATRQHPLVIPTPEVRGTEVVLGVEPQ